MKTTLARKITAALMTNGWGDKAVRIQLRGRDEKDLGGYCKNAVAALVDKELDADNNRAEARKGEVLPVFKAIIDLTDEQSGNINRIWKEHGKPGRAMLLQPLLETGAYRKLHLAVVDRDTADRVSDALKKP